MSQLIYIGKILLFFGPGLNSRLDAAAVLVVFFPSINRRVFLSNILLLRYKITLMMRE